jgi:2-polyprenyl-6-methoxyphenol hydroxylase-like FAD-dependent oxidoreductase
VAADGRHSVLREQAGLEIRRFGAPMDVLWMRLSRRPDDPSEALGRIDAGRVFVMLNRSDYWQCGYVIRKGAAEQLRARGIEALRTAITVAAPFLADRVAELATWDDVKLLTVEVDRLRRWHREGLLCIGDAAHAMSPIGGVGINLAVQDAVAAANVLVPAFQRGVPGEADLARVQKRRELPMRVTQALQLGVQKRIIGRVLAARRSLHAPWPVRLLNRFPRLRRIPARLVGLGVRPEHIETERLA